MTTWKRFLAVGCSHGNWADPTALNAVLKFKRNYNPHTTIHLGDYLDMASLRSGAKGADESVDIDDDLSAGVQFLRRLEPDIIFDGNHDDRIPKMLDNPNAKLAYCARRLNEKVNALTTELHAKRVHYDIERGWLKFGDTLFGHGYMYDEQALRGHAEAFGKCVIAHLHTPGTANGRRLDNPVAYCSGFLGDKDKFSYAKTSRSKLKWNQGFIWGEYSDNYTVVRIEQKAGEVWRLPA